MGAAYIKVFFDFEERTEGLNDTEKGRLLLAVLRYCASGGKEQPSLGGNERFVWPMLRGDYDRQMAVYQTKVDNGRKGGRPGDEKTETNRTETEKNRNKPEQKRTESEQNRNAQEKDKEKDKEKEKERETEKERALETSFEVFWNAYPRKEGKKAARKAWEKACPGPLEFGVIMDGLVKQKKSDQWNRDGGQFIPHPATWLNGERWKDEVQIGHAPRVTAQDYAQRDYSGEQEEALQRMLADMGS